MRCGGKNKIVENMIESTDKLRVTGNVFARDNPAIQLSPVIEENIKDAADGDEKAAFKILEFLVAECFTTYDNWNALIDYIKSGNDAPTMLKIMEMAIREQDSNLELVLPGDFFETLIIYRNDPNALLIMSYIIGESEDLLLRFLDTLRGIGLADFIIDLVAVPQCAEATYKLVESILSHKTRRTDFMQLLISLTTSIHELPTYSQIFGFGIIRLLCKSKSTATKWTERYPITSIFDGLRSDDEFYSMAVTSALKLTRDIVRQIRNGFEFVQKTEIYKHLPRVVQNPKLIQYTCQIISDTITERGGEAVSFWSEMGIMEAINGIREDLNFQTIVSFVESIVQFINHGAREHIEQMCRMCIMELLISTLSASDGDPELCAMITSSLDVIASLFSKFEGLNSLFEPILLEEDVAAITEAAEQEDEIGELMEEFIEKSRMKELA